MCQLRVLLTVHQLDSEFWRVAPDNFPGRLISCRPNSQLIHRMLPTLTQSLSLINLFNLTQLRSHGRESKPWESTFYSNVNPTSSVDRRLGDLRYIVKHEFVDKMACGLL